MCTLRKSLQGQLVNAFAISIFSIYVNETLNFWARVFQTPESLRSLLLIRVISGIFMYFRFARRNKQDAQVQSESHLYKKSSTHIQVNVSCRMSVITIQVGQCGNQIGGQLFETLIDDVNVKQSQTLVSTIIKYDFVLFRILSINYDLGVLEIALRFENSWNILQPGAEI